MFEEILRVIGEEATKKLIASFGGTRVYVPHFPRPDDPIAASIGLRAAEKLARIYGGDRVEIPNPTPRRKQILTLRARGYSVGEIARQARCTRRRVFQVLAEARAEIRASLRSSMLKA